jgi:hypothetical protein
MFTRIILGVAATLAFVGVGLFAIFSMQPSEMVVEHSLVIDATPETIFEEIEDFRAWPAWSPWAGGEREIAFDGAHRGAGAVFEWSVDEEAEAGRLTIDESRPGEFLSIDFETLKPVRSWSTMEFHLDAVEGGTRVTWTMRSETSLPMKAFLSMADLSEAIRADYEEGLNQLAAVVEADEQT